MQTMIISGLAALAILFLLFFPLLRKLIAEFVGYGQETTSTAEEVLAGGDSPVVYLRPFKIDGGKTSAWSNLERLGLISPTDEAEIASILQKVGPVIAIGNPGEDIPGDIGAARVQCPHDQWQAFILDWMKQAKMIVIVVSDSTGVEWELDTIRKNNFIAKTIFIISEEVDTPSKLFRFLKDTLKDLGEALPSGVALPCTVHFRNPNKPEVFRGSCIGILSQRASALDACLKSWLAGS